MAETLAGISSAIDRFSAATGRATAWLTLMMVVITLLVVVLRYAFDTGAVWLQELVTWMHAMVFMLGAAYTLRCDEHVRVDVFYHDMSSRRRALVNLFGVVFFILPLCVFFVFESTDYVKASWSIQEVSRDSGGLPYPFVPLLKSALVVMPVMVLLQGISLLLRSVVALREP